MKCTHYKTVANNPFSYDVLQKPTCHCMSMYITLSPSLHLTSASFATSSGTSQIMSSRIKFQVNSINKILLRAASTQVMISIC